ncbi:hypothetical protein JHK87_033824 [Glycine soja]|nr:hypothetical protein JHK87_033824 [Glycine soja]
MDMDFKGINPINQDYLVVVSIIIANLMVSRVLIDQGNFVDILYWKTFQRLEILLNIVHPHAGPLLNFAAMKQKFASSSISLLDDVSSKSSDVLMSTFLSFH